MNLLVVAVVCLTSGFALALIPSLFCAVEAALQKIGVETYFAGALKRAYWRGASDAFKGLIAAKKEERWCLLFQPGQRFHFNGIAFEVRAVSDEGMLVAPVGVTAQQRKRIERNREKEAEKALCLACDDGQSGEHSCEDAFGDDGGRVDA